MTHTREQDADRSAPDPVDPAGGALFLRKSATSVILKIAQGGLTLIVAVLLARTLGPAGYGVYAFVFALVSLLVLPAQFGLPTLIVRETARAGADGDWALIRGLWHWSTRFALTISGLLIAGGAITAWLFRDRLSDVETWTVAWGLVLIPLIALAALLSAALRGLHQVTLGQLPEFVIRLGLLVVLLVGWQVLGPVQLTAASAMGLHAAAAAVALIVATWLLHRHRPTQIASNTRPEMHSRNWFRSVLPLAFIGGAQLINTRADSLLLGILTDAETVGIYQVAVQGGNVVVLALGAINLVIAPQFASLYASGDRDQLQRLVTRSARLILGLTLPVVIMLIAFGQPMILRAFGAEYTDAYIPLVILTAGQLINAAFGSVAMLLNMTGHEQNTARALGLCAVLNIVLTLFLIPPLGMAGAALATSISLIVWNTSLWRIVRLKLGIRTTALLPTPIHRT